MNLKHLTALKEIISANGYGRRSIAILEEMARLWIAKEGE